MEPLRPEDPREAGPYRLERRLGGGGTGRVYLGRSRDGRPAAVRIVRAEPTWDASFRSGFAREVEALRKVGGPRVAPVVDAGVDADPPWLATAYVPGPSLRDAVGLHGPLPAPALAVLGAGLAEGLAAVRACGLAHRDVKPSNVVLAEDGPRLVDAGVARALDAAARTLPGGPLGGRAGTPAFMSPEQARGEPAGPPGDVFALASVLVFAATGRGPFGTGPAHAVLHRVRHERPDLSGVPSPLAELLAACLAKRPDDRPTADTVLDALAVPATGAPWPPPNVTALVDELRAATLEPPAAEPDAPDDPVERASLTVANFGRSDLQIIVDGAARCALPPGGRETLAVAAGGHSVQARAAEQARPSRRRSPLNRVEARPGEDVRLAFAVRGSGGTKPVLTRMALFTGPRVPVAARVAARWGVKGALLGGLVCGLLLSAGALDGAGRSAGRTLATFLAAGLAVGAAAGFLLALLLRPRSLRLDSRGLTVFFPRGRLWRKRIRWRRLAEAALVGAGPDARIVVRYRGTPGRPGRGRDGVVVCQVRDVSDGHDLAELRRALAWFAGDLYTDRTP
ncbi:serine/threonine-protein kinase [Spirillospora sp. NPDC052242]